MTDQTVSCPCGAATMTIKGEAISQFYCHCGDCRQMLGGGYALEAVYPADAVSVEGATVSFALKRTQRISCAACGTRLYADLPRIKMRGVNGTLLPGFKPEFHMHCREALAPVRDELPHYSKMPAAFGGEDTLVDW
ncbi:MAG: GFA family protein [Terricaulis sp.]